MAGSSIKGLAREHKVPESTVRGWTKGRRRVGVAPAPKKENEPEEFDLDAMAKGLVIGSVKAVRAILAAAEDPAWIYEYSPHEAAILVGVISDKLYRLLGAIQRPDSDTG